MKNYLFTALICCCVFNLFGQDTLTIGEVYNYDIGDKFHYKSTVEGQPYLKGTRRTILDKWISSNQDTVFYIIHHNNYIVATDINTGVTTTTYDIGDDTTFLAHLNQNISTLTTWGLKDTTDCDSSYYEYYYDTTDSYGGTIINGYFVECGSFEPYFHGRKWAKGLGEVRTYRQMHGQDQYWTYLTRMVYYKKGNKEWGDALMLDVKEHQNPSTFQVSPNPATTHISINNTNAGYLSVYNLGGELLFDKIAVDEKHHKINISFLSKGCYVLVWQEKNSRKTYHSKLIAHELTTKHLKEHLQFIVIYKSTPHTYGRCFIMLLNGFLPQQVLNHLLFGRESVFFA